MKWGVKNLRRVKVLGLPRIKTLRNCYPTDIDFERLPLSSLYAFVWQPFNWFWTIWKRPLETDLTFEPPVEHDPGFRNCWIFDILYWTCSIR